MRTIRELGAGGGLPAVPDLERVALSDDHERITVTGFGGVTEYPSRTVEANRDDAVRAIIDTVAPGSTHAATVTRWNDHARAGLSRERLRDRAGRL